MGDGGWLMLGSWGFCASAGGLGGAAGKVWLVLVLATGIIAVRAAIARSLTKGTMIWLIAVLLVDSLLIAQLWQWNLITLAI